MLPREELFFRILVFFALFTAVTGILNIAASGTMNSATLSMAISGGYHGSIPGQYVPPGSTGSYAEGANTAAGTIITDIDYTTLSQINQNITTLIGGPWTLTGGQGLVLTGLPLLPGTLNPSAVILRNAQSASNVYTENVKVDNSMSGGDFYIFPRFIDGYSGSDLKVVFAADGVHVKKFPLNYGILDAGDDYYYPLINARNTISGGSTITTALIEAISSSPSNIPDYTAQLTVSKDGVTLFTTSVRSILPGANLNDMVRHGGAGADSTNFVVKGFISTPVLDTSASIISGSGSNPITDFLGLIGGAVGLTNSAVVPFWLWCIVGLPCIATLIMIYIEIARGV